MSKISKKERDALKWVRSALTKRNNLKPDKNGVITADRCIKNNVIPASHFKMETGCSKNACGTIGCIAGWMNLKMMFDDAHRLDEDRSNAEVMSYSYKGPLYDLFFNYDVTDCDWGPGREYRKITRKNAVKAIDRVLSGKYKNPWQSALKR